MPDWNFIDLNYSLLRLNSLSSLNFEYDSLKIDQFAPIQTGMRSYFNGGGTPSSSSATPPPSMSSGLVGGRRSSSYLPAAGGRSSSASLPRSPDNDMTSHMTSQGSSHDVYVNIYQNTNHPSLFVSDFANQTNCSTLTPPPIYFSNSCGLVFCCDFFDIFVLTIAWGSVANCAFETGMLH